MPYFVLFIQFLSEVSSLDIKVQQSSVVNKNSEWTFSECAVRLSKYLIQYSSMCFYWKLNEKGEGTGEISLFVGRVAYIRILI